MLAQADQGIIVYGYFPAKTAMGISKKNLTAISCWVFCRKDQIWWHYNHKNAHQKFVSGSVSMMQQCITNNISKNKH